MTANPETIFLKFGGSLITDKAKPLTAREGVIKRLSKEIAAYRTENPQTRLVVGHGSGSFGHTAASKYQTQNGVWYAARLLNQVVIRHLSEAGLPVIAFPPSAGIIATRKGSVQWDILPIKEALSHDLIPVVQGDVVFDTGLGGTIFSTEQVFQYLARELQPARILLAGSDPGVYRDPDHSNEVVPSITPGNLPAIVSSLSGSAMTDVTGGMLSKVETMLALGEEMPGMTVQIFSAAQPNDLLKALAGERIGTILHR